MDISKPEQRVLHLLAQGGRIDFEKDERGRIIDITTVTRDGWAWNGCSLALFAKIGDAHAACTHDLPQVGLKPGRLQLRRLKEGLDLVARWVLD